tara:strand:- start:5 stop:220 length:216 start_codon:yes stop_codon:yes gene_type:complete
MNQQKDKKSEDNILKRTMTGIIDSIRSNKVIVEDDTDKNTTNDTDPTDHDIEQNKVTEDITELTVQMALTN